MQPDNTLGYTSTVGRCEPWRLTEFLTYDFHLYKFCNAYIKVRSYYPNTSLATLNRTLLTFHKIGLAKVVESTGEPKRFDPNLESHHHFRCINCGEIIDFRHEFYDALEIPAEIKEKFVVLEKKVQLEGFCDQCRATWKIDGQKARLCPNIAVAMQGVPDEIIELQLAHFEKVHPDYGAGVRAALSTMEKAM